MKKKRQTRGGAVEVTPLVYPEHLPQPTMHLGPVTIEAEGNAVVAWGDFRCERDQEGQPVNAPRLVHLGDHAAVSFDVSRHPMGQRHTPLKDGTFIVGDCPPPALRPASAAEGESPEPGPSLKDSSPPEPERPEQD